MKNYENMLCFHYFSYLNKHHYLFHNYGQRAAVPADAHARVTKDQGPLFVITPEKKFLFKHLHLLCIIMSDLTDVITAAQKAIQNPDEDKNEKEIFDEFYKSKRYNYFKDWLTCWKKET